jgi:hypothetical protein
METARNGCKLDYILAVKLSRKSLRIRKYMRAKILIMPPPAVYNLRNRL